MALKDLFFTIFAKDKTQDAFKSVNRRMRETEGHAATFSNRMNSAGKSLRNLGAAGSVASVGIIAAFRDSIGLFDQQARAEAKVKQAILATGGAAGFTAAALLDQASALQAVTRFGDEDILNKVTAQLLTFKNISGEAFIGAQQAALDLSTVLDGDLKSASIMLGKALNDPVKGLSAMSRAGVTFSEDQAEVIKSLAETGRIAEAQKLILDEIASAYGGQAAAAAAAGAGIVDQWRNTWGDVKEVVGSVLLDALRVIIPPLKAIAAAFTEASPATQRFVVVAGALAVALPPLAAAVGVLTIALAALGGPVTAVVIGLSALAAGAGALALASGGVTTALATELQATTDLAGALAGGIALSKDQATVKLAEARSRLANASAALEEMRTLDAAESKRGGRRARRDAGGGVNPEDKAALESQVDTIKANIAALEGVIAAGGTSVVDSLNTITPAATDAGDGVAKAMGEAKDAAEDAANSGAFDTIKGDLRSLIKDADGAGDAFERMRDRIIDAALQAATDPVFDALGAGISDFATAALAGMGSGSASGGGSAGALAGLADFAGSFGGLLGFDTGGAFTVRGRAGMDRNVARVRLSEGENVEVVRRGQANRAVNVTVNISTPDVRGFQQSRAQVAAQMRGALAAAERGA